jgi:hypothetical protein
MILFNYYYYLLGMEAATPRTLFYGWLLLSLFEVMRCDFARAVYPEVQELGRSKEHLCGCGRGASPFGLDRQL